MQASFLVSARGDAVIRLYLISVVLDSLLGGGLVYQLGVRDPIVWIAFIAGAVNGLAAVGALAVLIGRVWTPGVRDGGR